MARQPRQRMNGAFYHIICRSLSEFNLFRDDFDKTKYLDILYNATEEFNASLTSFCLLDTHVHFIINPNKVNISRFMKKVNCTYAKYYNHKYMRHGPVFSDRFKSKIIDSLEYFFTATCYIHFNTMDLGYSYETMKDYAFSSFRDYLTNTSTILNKQILLHLLSKSSYDFISLHQKHYSKDPKYDPNAQLEELLVFNETHKTSDEISENYYYSSGYPQQNKPISPSELLEKLFSQDFLLDESILSKSYYKKIHELRCIATNLLRLLCGITYRDIAILLGNMTISNIYWLNKKGHKLLTSTYNKSEILNALLN